MFSHDPSFSKSNIPNPEVHYFSHDPLFGAGQPGLRRAQHDEPKDGTTNDESC
jgi:hypothetical protein